MTTENMFEQVTKRKLRFDVGSGPQYSVEDLWDMPLTSRSKASLDGLYKAINKQIKESQEESYLTQQSSAATTLQLKLDIVKRVIDVRLDEKQAKDNAAKEKERKQKMLAMVSEIEDESLRDQLKAMTPEERKAILRG